MTSTLAARPAPSPWLDSPITGRRSLGAGMATVSVLDMIERLLKTADHPDIVKIERYGPGKGPWGPNVAESKVQHITGIRVAHQSTATASLWEAVWPGEQPVEAPEVAPAPRQNRAPRLLLLAKQLLDAAKPDQLRGWRLVTLPNLGNPARQEGLPFGLSLVDADGKQHLLRTSATGPTLGAEPESEPFPDYVIPEKVRTCLNGSSTTKTNPGLPADAVSVGRS